MSFKINCRKFSHEEYLTDFSCNSMLFIRDCQIKSSRMLNFQKPNTVLLIERTNKNLESCYAIAKIISAIFWAAISISKPKTVNYCAKHIPHKLNFTDQTFLKHSPSSCLLPVATPDLPTPKFLLNHPSLQQTPPTTKQLPCNHCRERDSGRG